MKYFWQKFRSFLVIMAFLIAVAGGKTLAMEITIVTSTGKTFSTEADTENSIAEIKDFVFNVTHIYPGNQRMYKDSTELESTRTLGSYNITDGDTIYVKMGIDNLTHEDTNSGSLVKILVIIVILGVIYFIVRKKF